MSASANSNDRQALYDSVLHSKDDESEHETTRSGDEDEFLSELVKEYESDDTVGDSLKSEQLAKLVNKMFRCKLSKKNLKMNANKPEEQLLDYREDEQLSDLDDHGKNNSDLHDGPGSPCGSNNNNNQTPHLRKKSAF